MVAVYFVQPTPDNLERIRNDFAQNLYTYYSFHFTNPISRTLLEDLAQWSVQYGLAKQVIQVTDEYSDFVCLEDSLFSLEKSGSFCFVNDSRKTETDMQSFLASQANSLLSVCVSLDLYPPFIRFEKGSSAEMLATITEAKLREHFYNYPPRKAGTGLLIVLDRMSDLSTGLRHTWTYGGMIYDLFNVKLNQIKLKMFDENAQKHVQKVYDIDSLDYFWKSHHFKPFNQVAEELDVELKNYKLETEKMSAKLAAENAQGGEQHDNIRNALTVMPELEKKKRLLDMHMNLAMAILEQVQKRQIDKFYELEGIIASYKKPLLKSALQDWMKDLGGSAEDRLRLLIVFYLRSSEMTKVDLTTVYEALFNGDLSSDQLETPVNGKKLLDFAVEFKSLKNMTASPISAPPSSSPSYGSPNTSPSSPPGDFGRQIKTQLSSHYSYVGGVLGNFISNVRTTLMDDCTKDMAILKITDQLLSLPFSETSLPQPPPVPRKDPTSYQCGQFTQLDPLKKKPSGLVGSPQFLNAESTSKVVIFILGGLSFEEYLHIHEFVLKKWPKIHLSIGSSEILSAAELMTQMSAAKS